MLNNAFSKQRPTFRALIPTLVIAVVSFGLSLTGVILSTYVQTWPAYTSGTYVAGVVLFLFFVGPFFIFTWLFSLRAHALSRGIFVHVVLGVLYVLLIALVISLLIVPPWGKGYQNLWAIWVGFFLLFLLLPSLALEVYKGVVWFRHLVDKKAYNSRAAAEMVDERQLSRHLRTPLTFLGLVAVMVLALFLISLFPPQWNQPTRSVQSEPSNMAVFNINVGSEQHPWYMKVFPDQLMYWSWALLILTLSWVLLSIPHLRRLLHLPLKINLYWTNVRLSLGEAILIFSFVGLFIWWVWYWSTGYADPDNREFGRIAQLPELERISRTLGHCNTLLISFLVLPISRNSVWMHLLGVSYERGIRFHRWLAVATIISTSMHMFFWWARWNELGQWLDQFSIFPNVIGPPCELDSTCHNGNFLMPILFTAYIVLLIIFLTALDMVRRRWYEVFYYTHFLTWFYVLVAVVHAWAMWNYLLLGGIFYLADKVIRHVRALHPVKLVSLTRTPDTHHSRLVLARTSEPFIYAPGQYAWLNIPCIDPYQWHPFSLVYNADGNIEFVIKAIAYPHRTWTSSLLSMADSGRDGRRLNSSENLPLLITNDPLLEVYVDGPYGNLEMDPNNYEIILLVAGGIGVTPIYSLFMHLANNTPPHLESCTMYWTAQSSDIFDIFIADLEAVVKQRNNFHIQLCATREDIQPLADDSRLEMHSQVSRTRRIDFSHEFSQIQQNRPHRHKVCVFACGPTSLLSRLRDLCHEFRFDIHVETDRKSVV